MLDDFDDAVLFEREARDADALEDHVNEVGAAILECDIPVDPNAEAEAKKWASPTLSRPRRGVLSRPKHGESDGKSPDLGSLIESFVSSCARTHENPVWALHRQMLEAKTNDFVAST